ncbi:hypothetical protein CsSME_00036612 [Camellia sinensis var. sinensis]
MSLERLSLGPTPHDSDAATGDDGSRAPRLPRWTRQEILVLIQGKRVAENRVRRGRTVGMAFGTGQVEPKWASVSSYCKRHGVNRGPVQCRKRWSNLAGDYKKIKEWESQIREEAESFWVMRNDLRRERKLPGFFDREVYDILHGGTTAGAPTGLAPAEEGKEGEEQTAAQEVEVEVEAEAVFDSVKLYVCFDDSTTPVKQSNPETGATSQEGRKRKRFASDADEETNTLQSQLIEVLERNGRMVSAQLESQNTNFQLDREQRKDHVDGLVAVLHKLADALGRIADKL